ncbi:MAG: tRNA lysidine(34) synthetase TilS [Mariprofundus sp.]|nr:tRNA lysidine(34) synthetase TilS [Mariprofundus sp.]
MNIENEYSVFNGWLSTEDIPPLSDELAVGWSGGADSTALLLALKAHGYRVQAWHVDHGWRHSSSDEAARLAEKAAGWKIPFISACLREPSNMPGGASSTRNSEAEARKGRYAQFQRWSRESGLTTLCLAHHRDDQAETVYMRLLQGAGPAGCRGMWRERQMDGLRIVRPLLHLSGQQLRQALVLAGIDWFEDPSNADMSIWRNRIRHQLFPAMEKSGVSPDKLFLRWQHQADRVARSLDEVTDSLLNNLSKTGQNGICLPWQAWKDVSPAVRARLLQKLMVQLLGEGVTPGRRHILLIESWTKRNGRGGLDLSRCRLYREFDRLHLQPASAGFACKNRAVA